MNEAIAENVVRYLTADESPSPKMRTRREPFTQLCFLVATLYHRRSFKLHALWIYSVLNRFLDY